MSTSRPSARQAHREKGSDGIAAGEVSCSNGRLKSTRSREWLLPGIVTSSGTMHGFREPDDLQRVTGGDPLLLELIETPAFRRLKEIRFLGAIDYHLVPRPNGKPGATRYTRYEHSIGVMQLAWLYCDLRDLQPMDRRLACVAALLHDLGHPPFSHSMESVFKEEFGFDHHEATADIIHGESPFGKEVFETLCRHGMDVEKLTALISGEVPEFDGFFHGRSISTLSKESFDPICTFGNLQRFRIGIP